MNPQFDYDDYRISKMFSDDVSFGEAFVHRTIAALPANSEKNRVKHDSFLKIMGFLAFGLAIILWPIVVNIMGNINFGDLVPQSLEGHVEYAIFAAAIIIGSLGLVIAEQT